MYGGTTRANPKEYGLAASEQAPLKKGQAASNTLSLGSAQSRSGHHPASGTAATANLGGNGGS